MYCTECGAKVPDGSTYCVACGALIQEELIVSDAQASRERMHTRSRSGALTLFLCFLCLSLAAVFEVIGYVIGYALGIDEMTTSSVGAALGSVIGVVALGGKEWVLPNKKAFLVSLEEGWWLLAVSAGVTGLAMVISALSGENLIEKGWMLRFVSVGIMCAGIGISEEAMFRVLVFGGILDLTGKDRKGIYVAVLLSALLFGFAHIDWVSFDYSSVLDWAQALLKVAQTGALAFFFCAVALYSNTMTGVAFLHGLSDFFYMMPSYVLLGMTEEISYVSSGEDGVAAIVIYLVLIGLYIPLVKKGKDLFARIPAPNYGPLHKA